MALTKLEVKFISWMKIEPDSKFRRWILCFRSCKVQYRHNGDAVRQTAEKDVETTNENRKYSCWFYANGLVTLLCHSMLWTDYNMRLDDVQSEFMVYRRFKKRQLHGIIVSPSSSLPIPTFMTISGLLSLLSFPVCYIIVQINPWIFLFIS